MVHLHTGARERRGHVPRDALQAGSQGRYHDVVRLDSWAGPYALVSSYPSHDRHILSLACMATHLRGNVT